MDPKPKPKPDVNSQIDSLVTSVGQLDLIDAITGRASINRLPNELLKHILVRTKVKLPDYDESYHNYAYYYDVKLLVQLRLLSTRWRAIVEEFCRLKRSLCVNPGHRSDLILSDCAPLNIDTKSAKFFSKLPKLFPNILQLDLGCLGFLNDTEMPSFALNIVQLSCLKQLEAALRPEGALPFLSPTLSQLEVISLTTTNGLPLNLLQFVGQLGPDCRRVYLNEGCEMNFSAFRRWHRLKSHFLGSVTHLHIRINRQQRNDYEKVVQLLCVHAKSLKELYFNADSDPFLLTGTVLSNLRKLTNLTSLELYNVDVDVLKFGEAAALAQLPSLSSVLVCKIGSLSVNWTLETTADQLMHILSVIFPKLVNLYLSLEISLELATQQPPDEYQIEQHLDRFPNLREYFVEVCISDWTIDGERIPLNRDRIRIRLTGFPMNVHV